MKKKVILAVAALGGIAGFTMVKASPSTKNTRLTTTIAVADTAPKNTCKIGGPSAYTAVKTTLTTDPL